jgi:uncharacterized protein (UPF0332 family)
MEQNKALSEHRFEQALSCLKQSRLLIAAGEYKGAANRSYYAVFHAMRSVLALEGRDFGKHTAVMGHFRKEYIKTNIFDKQLSGILTLLFDVRNDSDYDDFYIINKEDVTDQLKSAEYFLGEIRKFLDTQMGNSQC